MGRNARNKAIKGPSATLYPPTDGKIIPTAPRTPQIPTNFGTDISTFACSNSKRRFK
jgi:hypothetical protein